MEGWRNLGAAFGGDSEKSYQEGLALGAKTEDALAAARERVEKNAARARMAQELRATGLDENTANAASTALTAGASLTDPIQLMLKNQEFGFRAKAGDPNVSLDEGNRALLGVASGPVEPIYKVGNRALNKFETPDVADLGEVFGGDVGSSSFIQSARAFGLLNPDGSISPENRALAYEILRNTDKAFDVGGVPMIRTGNPYGMAGGAVQPAVQAPGAPPQGPQAAGPTLAASAPAAAPLASVDQVAANTAAITSAKKQGEMQGTAAAALPDAQADIAKMRGNIQNLLTQPGFDRIYGNVQGNPLVGAVQSVADMSNETANARAALAQLDAQAFGVSIQTMRGLGQLSNAEGLKVTQAFTRATNPTISEAEARQAWAEVLATLDLADQRAQMKAGATPAVPGVTQPPASQGGEAKVLGGKKYVKINGQWFEDDGT